MSLANSTSRALSPEAQAAAGWLRQLARALKLFRLYRADNPLVHQTQRDVAAALVDLVHRHGGWALRFSAAEIFLDDEPLVRMGGKPGEEPGSSVVHSLPFLFYRDGIRHLRFAANLGAAEAETFVGCFRIACSSFEAQDDLVTLLWQANLNAVQIDAVPLEMTIYLTSRAGGAKSAEEKKGQVYAWAPTGGEIRADLGQMAAAQGLHRDTFDDWELPAEGVDVREAWKTLEPLAASARIRFLSAWERENEGAWTDHAAELLRKLLELDPSPDMRQSLARSLVTWIGGALGRGAWDEAQRALAVLHEIDPDRSVTGDELRGVLAALDPATVAERLDEGDAEDHARFSAFTVALGPPALEFGCEVLARAGKARARAAACTALCYLCGEQPELLAPWLADSRWHVVRNIVFVLGLIGGPPVVPLLRAVVRHEEPRVRRQLVQALGSVPREDRIPILLDQLDTRDPQLLAAALNMLLRDKDPAIAAAILETISEPGFESRSENNQRVLFGALAEVADDAAVPPLEALVHKGGWFARRTPMRAAAARTLVRIGTPAALEALEAGLRSRSEAVRSVCLEALASRSRA